MRSSNRDLPVVFEGAGAVSRQAEWGSMNVAIESIPAGTDTTPLFKGLPDDRCQCPHWGYVTRGQFRVMYGDHEEVVRAGDAYYLTPGHAVVFEQDTEVIEYSPQGEYQKTMDVIAHNMAAMEQS